MLKPIFIAKSIKTLFVFSICLFVFYTVHSQNRKTIQATSISDHIIIDGVLNEESWNAAKTYSDFIQFEPYNNKKPFLQTFVKIIYDNSGIYFGIYMHDSHPDSILKELSHRDGIDAANTDQVVVVLLPYNDDQNAFFLKVSAAGVQQDWKVSPQGTDLSWDAVWNSEVSISDSGWVAEFKIPYNVIRFPEVSEQVWGVNVWRQIRRNREWSTLNWVDNSKEGSITTNAILTGINNIKPPLRLSLYPYIAGYAEKTPDNSKFGYSFNYGMDLKYGISESFTLDMTLIPDFGQVQSDDIVLNLSPFEVQYDEKRQFFTEGTELFKKAGVFYSRRIGAQPINYYQTYYQLNEGESIIENPSKTNLINAIKLSGRTKKGMGVGLFNAITSPSKALIEDSNGVIREFTTQPFANYNIFVLDKTLKNRSYIGFINTNVSMKDYSANVSGFDFSFENKKNSYQIGGKVLGSNKYYASGLDQSGFQYSIGFNKISGNFRFGISNKVISDNYDHNDLGFLQQNNLTLSNIALAYNIYKPFWKVHFWFNSISFSYYTLYKSMSYNAVDLNISSTTRFKNHLSAGISAGGSPVFQYDYYEARIPENKFYIPGHVWAYAWISPDYRKKFVVDLRASTSTIPQFQNNSFSVDISPRLRINDKLFITGSINNAFENNNKGFADLVSDSIGGLVIVFGNRDVKTLENSLKLSYIFSNKVSLSFRMRHYWSVAEFDKFYLLQNDGHLISTVYNKNLDINFNAFTIDMNFIWQFAPGSEMAAVWKNAIYTQGSQITRKYFNNVEEVLNNPATNSLSLKILYYLDYQYLIKKTSLKK